jgi:uncharacterized protein YceH (UPF0502 family)
MHPLESLDVVKNMLRAMQERSAPLVRELPPSPGSRAERYAQLLCPNLHPLDVPSSGGDVKVRGAASAAPPSGERSLAQRVAELENEVAQLRGAVRRLAESLGESDPLADLEQPAQTPA